MKTKDIIYMLALAAVLLLLVDRCQRINSLGDEKAELIKAYRDNGLGFTLISNNVARQRDLVLELSKKQSRLLMQNEALKKEVHALKSQVGIRYVLDIDTIRDTSWMERIIRLDSLNALPLPLKFKHDTKWFSFTQSIDTLGINTYSGIQVWDSVTIHHYVQKRRLKDVFRPRETMVYAEFSSPYARVDGMHSVTIRQKRKFYEKPWVWGLAGFAISTAIFAK